MKLVVTPRPSTIIGVKPRLRTVNMKVRSLHAEAIRFLTLPWTSQQGPLHLRHGGGEGLVPGWDLGPLLPRRAGRSENLKAASIYAEMKKPPVPTCRWPSTRATLGTQKFRHQSSTHWLGELWVAFLVITPQYFRCRRRGFDPTLGISCMPPG